LAYLFAYEDEFDDANAHIKQAKSHAVHSAYNLARAMELQADIWRLQHRLEDAKSEVLHALEVLEKLEAVEDMRVSRITLQKVEHAIKSSARLQIAFFDFFAFFNLSSLLPLTGKLFFFSNLYRFQQSTYFEVQNTRCQKASSNA
jgi:predicted nucleic acid-binding protein